MLSILANLALTLLTLTAFSYYLFRQIVSEVPAILADMVAEERLASIEAQDTERWYRKAISKRHNMIEELSTLKNRRNLSDVEKRRKKELGRLIKVNTQTLKDILHDFETRHDNIDLSDRLEKVTLFQLAYGIHLLVEHFHSSQRSQTDKDS